MAAATNISEEPVLIVRPYGFRVMDEANNIVDGWMRMAGMETDRDEIGNLSPGDGEIVQEPVGRLVRPERHTDKREVITWAT